MLISWNVNNHSYFIPKILVMNYEFKAKERCVIRKENTITVCSTYHIPYGNVILKIGVSLNPR